MHDWPGYDSDGACDNIIHEKAPPAMAQPLQCIEMLAVKNYFIKKGFAEPVLNVTDFLKETGKPYYKSFMFQGISPSQFLIKL